MTIDEMLAGVPGDQIIKIGTEHGTGFFFCGTVDEYRKREYTMNEQMLRTARDRLRSTGEVIANMAKDKPKRVLNAHKSHRNAIDSYVKFKMLWKREVKNSFTACELADEKQPMVIIVDGDEYGSFWTTEDTDALDEHFSLGWRWPIPEATV